MTQTLQPPMVLPLKSNPIGVIFWVVAYGRLYCIKELLALLPGGQGAGLLVMDKHLIQEE